MLPAATHPMHGAPYRNTQDLFLFLLTPPSAHQCSQQQDQVRVPLLLLLQVTNRSEILLLLLQRTQK